MLRVSWSTYARATTELAGQAMRVCSRVLTSSRTCAAATQYAHAVPDLYLGNAIRTTATEGSPRREPPAQTFYPTPAQLEAFAGTYTSDEAETVFTIAVEGEALVRMQTTS